MIYKTLKKVSDYCQLLDKSKYPNSTVHAGITWTNNGDGSWTADGTSTGLSFVTNFFKSTKNLGVHKVAILINNDTIIDNVYIELRIQDTNGKRRYFYYRNNITTFLNIDNFKEFGMTLIVQKAGVTLNNYVFKPQLFDLTEMYGVGNEPTTVEEFKADFPNDLYDYKPYCFVPSYKNLLKATDDTIITSYKKSLRCTTKNLFDKSLVKMPNDLGQGTSIGTTNNGWIMQGGKGTGTGWSGPGTAAWVNGWFRPGYAAYTNNKKGIMLNGGDTVRVSAYYTILEDNIAGAAYDDIYVALGGPKTYNGYVHNFHPAVGVKTRISRTITIENGYDGAYYPTFSLNSCKVLIEDIQVEYGTTSTEYHPYGYL